MTTTPEALLRTPEVERLAFAIHEADLGTRCKARGDAKAQHSAAYINIAVSLVHDLARRWQPKVPPKDVLR